MAKKVLVLMRKAPYGTFYSYEGLQTVLIMGAYEIDVSIAFVDDGVYVITKGQDTEALGVRQVAKTFPALPDFNVETFYIHKESLDERGLTLDDLVIQPEVLDTVSMAGVLEDQEVILPF
jgi:tRNA 2-thiouridine synthesizing protein C